MSSKPLAPLTPLEVAARNFRAGVGGSDAVEARGIAPDAAAICGVPSAQCDRGASDHVERLKVWRSILPDRSFMSQAEKDQLFVEYRVACQESTLARAAISGPSPAWVQPKVGLGARSERAQPLRRDDGRGPIVGFVPPVVQIE